MNLRLHRIERDVLKSIWAATFVLLLGLSGAGAAQELKLDERPAEPEEWGYRPADGAVSQVNPPSFSWRPQPGLTWEV